MNHTSDFDLDLKFGQVAEKEIGDILFDSCKVEVKTDKQWHKTNNMFFTHYYSPQKNKIPSFTEEERFELS